MSEEQFKNLQPGDKVKSPLGAVFTVKEWLARKVILSGPDYLALSIDKAKAWEVVNG